MKKGEIEQELEITDGAIFFNEDFKKLPKNFILYIERGKIIIPKEEKKGKKKPKKK